MNCQRVAKFADRQKNRSPASGYVVSNRLSPRAFLRRRAVGSTVVVNSRPQNVETPENRSCRISPLSFIMKPVSLFTAAALALLSVVPAQAQLFRPETVRGAVLGGVAGAVIGHNDGRHGWEGAAYGAAAGALIGSVVGHARDSHDHYRTQPPRPSLHVHAGWSSGPRWRSSHYPHHRWDPYPRWSYHRGWDRHRHRSWATPAWDCDVAWSRPYPYYSRSTVPASYATRGALLGGLAGAIIGHNDGRHGWEGAAYGLGAGYLLGRVADAQARRAAVERGSAVPVYAAPQYAPAASSQPSQVTIINNYYAAPPSSPMTAANGFFGR